MRIPADVVEFVSYCSGFLATRDRANRPTAAESAVIALDPETGLGEIAANARFARHMADNLRDNGRFAMNCARSWGDHRSVQLKGRCLEIREPSPIPDRLARTINYLRDMLPSFGIPQQVADDFGALQYEPYWVVRVQVEEVFDQTPGPGAGKALS